MNPSVYGGTIRKVLTRSSKATPFWQEMLLFTGRTILVIGCFGVMLVCAMAVGNAIGDLFYTFMQP